MGVLAEAASNPAGAWQDQQFSFVDETGALTTGPVKNFLNSTALGYTYENTIQCSRIQPSLLAVAPSGKAKPMSLMSTSKTILIRKASTTVDLKVPAPTLQGVLQNQAPGNVELVLRDITAERHPGVLFEVFIAKKGAPQTRVAVGTISGSAPSGITGTRRSARPFASISPRSFAPWGPASWG